ncbi:alpha/beta hydrolase [Janthinobacterium sp. 17J80-10]|uniref:alpha/beta hydrolase n=1 Tax=Janthinobacterium sp. 17J80-10 TaxID=2497863 RepID=UPI0010057DD8|nr:alpha/beta hydrolase [Janthinobacterium sp. 17J80-10]QAU34555.1 alpha/beta hydrolase [Janthinobacterium sp. 17J80-10]
MLDADARKLLDLINSKHVPPYEAMPPVAARAFFKAGAFTSQPPAPQLARVENLLAEGPAGTIPVRHYRPLPALAGTSLPVLVFFHGGGFTLGDIDTHDVLCRQLCDQAGIAVVSVDYRLGPEHKFPAAHVDCFAALQWVVAQADRLGINPARIAVGGDSAGGNIAAACALMARDSGGPSLAFQLLIYPATDFRCIAPSHKRNGEDYLLTSTLIEYFCACYLNSPADRLDWRLSPVLAASHAKLPPALILTAGYDPLVDEGREYAERLQLAGVQSEHVCYEGQLHGFITMGRFIAQANEAVALCADRLRTLHDDTDRMPASHAA